MSRAKIQQATNTIYARISNEGQGDLLPDLVAGPYIQHNPNTMF